MEVVNNFVENKIISNGCRSREPIDLMDRYFVRISNTKHFFYLTRLTKINIETSFGAANY